MDALLQDVKIALRLLWRDRGFAAAVLLTLSLCVGANVTIFTAVYSILLKPLPVPESERILVMSNSYPGAGLTRGGLGWSGVPDYYDRLRDLDLFEEQALFDFQGVNIGSAGSAERVEAMGVTPSFFRLLRVPPHRGRIFIDAEGEIGNERVVILSYALWQRLFGGLAEAVGQEVRLNGRPHTVVGVMPPEFHFVRPEVQLWAPLAFTAEQRSDERRHSNSWTNVGRLQPGRTIAEAHAQVDALNARNLERFPQFKEALLNARFSTTVRPLQEVLVEETRGPLYLLWAGATFLLLIGCVNVANLLLMRTTVRLKELATRAALGAGRWRLSRQLVSESVLVTLVSGGLGLLLARGALVLLQSSVLETTPRWDEIAMDAVVVLVTLGLSVLIGCGLGAAPAVASLTADLQVLLRQEGRGASGGRGADLFRRALVAVEISAACMLLIGAVLLFASFRAVSTIEPGFETDHLLTATVYLPEVRYTGEDALREFAARAAERLRGIPGVVSVGIADVIPFGGSLNSSVIQAVGYVPQPGESLIAPTQVRAGEGYLEAAGIALVEGRLFDERDTVGSQPVVIVDELLARRFWPHASPLGQQMFSDVRVGPKTTLYTVVGVVRSVRMVGLVDPGGFTTTGAYYFAHGQRPIRQPTFAMRTERDPGAIIPGIRAEIERLDPELPLFDVKTMEERIETSLVGRRAPMTLALAFAVAALFLSAVGVYSVVAYRVTQRTREIGIRVALGSPGTRIFRLVLADGMRLLSAGLLVGLVGAFLLRRLIESQLYGVEPTDPTLVGASLTILAATALVASAVPARRATRLDPVVALSR